MKRQKTLAKIEEEAKLSAKELGIELGEVSTKKWEKEDNVGSVEVTTIAEGILRINYFKAEHTAHFCNVKRGESRLADRIGYRLGEQGFWISYT